MVHFLSLFSTLLCASTALAASSPHKRNVFNKARPSIEKRMAGQPFQHPELQKRADRFMTDKTKGMCIPVGSSTVLTTSQPSL
jgi:carboxypeptidase D